MKSLVVFAALLLVGCSVRVTHENENKAETESLFTSDKSKTTVAVGVLEAPEPSPETNQTDSATPSIERSTTIVKVIVPEPSPEVVNSPPPPIVRCPERTIRVTGSDNIVVLGDIHHHHEHKHFHIHETPKPTPLRINVRVELNDQISERERRRRMVQKRISRFFPNYGN